MCSIAGTTEPFYGKQRLIVEDVFFSSWTCWREWFMETWTVPLHLLPNNFRESIHAWDLTSIHIITSRKYTRWLILFFCQVFPFDSYPQNTKYRWSSWTATAEHRYGLYCWIWKLICNTLANWRACGWLWSMRREREIRKLLSFGGGNRSP